jgi:hypothetical protein
MEGYDEDDEDARRYYDEERERSVKAADPQDVEQRESGAEGWRDDYCADCGEPVPIGGWPFCASDHNPEGHAKGAAYGFRMKFTMKTQGWTRRER